jgi:hypothetical protein
MSTNQDFSRCPAVPGKERVKHARRSRYDKIVPRNLVAQERPRHHRQRHASQRLPDAFGGEQGSAKKLRCGAVAGGEDRADRAIRPPPVEVLQSPVGPEQRCEVRARRLRPGWPHDAGESSRPSGCLLRSRLPVDHERSTGMARTMTLLAVLFMTSARFERDVMP